MGDTQVHYRLPLSAVRVTGTVCRTHDTILNKHASEPSVSAEITVVADPTTSIDLTYGLGILRDTNLALEVTEDGRLTSGSSEVTGQVGKIVTGIAGIAATGIGLAVGGFPAAAMVAAAGAAAVRAQTVDEVKAATPADVSSDDWLIAVAYRKKYGQLADARKELADRVAGLAAEVPKISGDVAAIKVPEERLAKIRELRAVDGALAIARGELDRLDRHFATWRVTTITSTVEDVERLVTSDEISLAGPAKIKDGELAFETAPPTDPTGPRALACANVTALWKEFGLLIQISDDQPVKSVPPAAKPKKGHIVLREPRPAMVKVSKRGADGAPVLASERRHLILDNRAIHRTFQLRTSAFGRKTSKVTFSAAGVPTGYASGSTSSVAAIAQAASELPATIAGGIKQAGEIMDHAGALRTKTLDYELARVKKEVELHQQRILEAGISATEEDQANLLRLQQRQAVLEAGKAIDELEAVESAPGEVQRLQAEVELLKARLDVAVLRRAVSSEAALGRARLDLDALLGLSGEPATEDGAAVR